MNSKIWIYADWAFNTTIAPGSSNEEAYAQVNLPRTCEYCGTPMRALDNRILKHWDETRETQTRWVEACDTCGWWAVLEQSSKHYMEDSEQQKGMVVARLQELDLYDLSLPLNDLRRYLLASYERRFSLNPRRYEELVADVFSSLGYELRLTSYSRDDGIDIFVFDGPNDVIQGIQIKRYSRKIEAAQIREFGGALVLNGLTKGVYVTTSDYTKGAKDTAQRYEMRGLGIELLDAPAFYDRMKVGFTSPYLYADEPTAPFAQFLEGIKDIPKYSVWCTDN